MGDQLKSIMPATLILFLSSSPKEGVSYTESVDSAVILAKKRSSCDHLKIGHTLGPSALNDLFLTPVRVSQMMMAVGSSPVDLAEGEKVTMYFSQGLKSMN